TSPTQKSLLWEVASSPKGVGSNKVDAMFRFSLKELFIILTLAACFLAANAFGKPRTEIQGSQWTSSSPPSNRDLMIYLLGPNTWIETPYVEYGWPIAAVRRFDSPPRYGVDPFKMFMNLAIAVLTIAGCIVLLRKWKTYKSSRNM